MSASEALSIAVVGGGIGGLCLTIGLLRASSSRPASSPPLRVTLYESAPAFAEIGAGVSFGPNSVHAMNLISPAIGEGYRKRETRNASPAKEDVWFDFRAGMDLGLGRPGADVGDVIATVRDGRLGQSSVHRAHFLDELVGLLPDDVARFGKRAEHVEEVELEGRKKLQIRFHDGSIAFADAVIGADGIKSTMRQLLLGREHPAAKAVFSGKYAYRGLVPMDKAREAVGRELAENSQLYMGRHGHVLTFPIEQGKTMNVVAFRTKDGEWEDERWVLPMKKEDMYEDFRGWGDSVLHVLEVS